MSNLGAFLVILVYTHIIYIYIAVKRKRGFRLTRCV